MDDFAKGWQSWTELWFLYTITTTKEDKVNTGTIFNDQCYMYCSFYPYCTPDISTDTGNDVRR
jgi:hypothetical protein